MNRRELESEINRINRALLNKDPENVLDDEERVQYGEKLDALEWALAKLDDFQDDERHERRMGMWED